MSKGNPRKAMAALLPSGGAIIRPMTLGVWAALERIESPLVTGKPPKDTLELIPSLYLLTHDPREVFRGNVIDLSMAWADTQPVTVMQRIKDAAEQQMQAFLDVLPETEKKKSPEMTVGSQSTSTGRPGHTGGASKRSCGSSLQAHSPSCAGRNGRITKETSTASRSLKSRR